MYKVICCMCFLFAYHAIFTVPNSISTRFDTNIAGSLLCSSKLDKVYIDNIKAINTETGILFARDFSLFVTDGHWEQGVDLTCVVTTGSCTDAFVNLCNVRRLKLLYGKSKCLCTVRIDNNKIHKFWVLKPVRVISEDSSNHSSSHSLCMAGWLAD